MPREKNKYGLSRDIPAGIMRRIRQECGFGCVLCGKLPYQYEHFDPEWSEARGHSPQGIALLCPGHHQDKTSGRLTPRAVADARRAPFNKTNPAVWSSFLGPGHVVLCVGGLMVHGGKGAGIVVNNTTILEIQPSTQRGEPWQMAGNLVGPDRRELFRFRRNEVIVSTGSWDVEMSGTRFVVRHGPGDIVAEFNIRGSAITINRLSMPLSGGHWMRVQADGALCISGPDRNVRFEGEGTSAVGEIDMFRVFGGNALCRVSLCSFNFSPRPAAQTCSRVYFRDQRLGDLHDWTC